jgi:hypothetical protein
MLIKFVANLALKWTLILYLLDVVEKERLMKNWNHFFNLIALKWNLDVLRLLLLFDILLLLYVFVFDNLDFYLLHFDLFWSIIETNLFYIPKY